MLCPFRVARVSRLIGKSDITVNRCGWQVEPCRSVGSGSAARHLHQESQAPQKRKERHSQESGAPWSLCWSLAPQDYVGNGIFPLHLLETSRSVSPFSGPLRWRLLLPGVFSILGWSKCSQRLNITGAYLIAIVMPFIIMFIFNILLRLCRKDFLDYGSRLKKTLLKTIETCLTADTADSNASPVLQARCAGSDAGSGGREGR